MVAPWMGSKVDEMSGRGYLFLMADLIQAPIVNTGPQALILLLYKEKPGSYRGGGWSDDPCF